MRLLEKVEGSEPLQEEDYKTLSSLLCEIRSKRERINFFFIFLLSVLALIVAVYTDFIV